MSSNQDTPEPPEPKTTLQRFPGRFTKLSLLFLAGTVVALAARYLLPENVLVYILLWAWLGLSFVLLLLLFLNWYLKPSGETTPRKDVIDIFIKIASSALFILSLVVAWLSFDLTRQETTKNLKLAETALENNRAEQRSRRFTDALERLGGDTTSKRLAGIAAFTHLDSEIESEADFTTEEAKRSGDELETLRKQRAKERAEHWAIIRVLTSYVQQYLPVVPKDNPTKALKPPDEGLRDIDEILRYLGTRDLTFEAGELARLDFTSADLTGYFTGKVPEKCNEPGCNPDCNTTNFEGADFSGARLIWARFQGVKLRKAIFNDADLTKANFDCVDLTGAQFRNANISGADFSRAQFISDDQLSGAFGDAETKCPDKFTFNGITCVK